MMHLPDDDDDAVADAPGLLLLLLLLAVAPPLLLLLLLILLHLYGRDKLWISIGYIMMYLSHSLLLLVYQILTLFSLT